ncbi:CDP-alcohol phosphatidyltransferase [Mycetocola zhujimingii]|nr:CDP-alcohol phosphatidyltransferase [Mycetocola zhujimingii]
MHPVTTFKLAYAELVQAQKPKKGVSLYSRHVNRPLGRMLAAALHSVGASPNQVTLLSAIATTAGLAVLVSQRPGLAVGIVVALLLALGFALDSADGQVARLSGRQSPAGEWLDHVVDAAKMVAVHGCVFVAAWLHTSVETLWLSIPLVFQVISTLLFAGGTLLELIERSLPARREVVPSRPSTVRAVGLLPADYGVLCLSFVVWGFTPVFVVAYSLLFLANAAIAAMLLTKWFRELSARP